MASNNIYLNAVTRSDKARLQAAAAKWNKAKKAGDKAGMSAAHREAEAIRAAYGFSGGTGGGGAVSTLKASGIGYLDQITETKRQADIAALKGAYDASMLELDAQAAALPEAYRAAKNEAAAQSEIGRAAWNEYAAGSGLNTGAGGQAALVRTAALQRELYGLNRELAAAQADIGLRRAQLEAQYKGEIRTALAKGEADRANALYKAFQERADTMAAAGVFSDYKKLGYSDSYIRALQDQWYRKNSKYFL